MTAETKELKRPSIAELQRLVRDKTRLEFHLVNGKKLYGRIKWFDDQAISMVEDDDSTFTLLRPALVGYKIKSKSN